MSDLFPHEIRIMPAMTANLRVYLAQAQLYAYSRICRPLPENCATVRHPVRYVDGEVSYLLSAYCWEENRYTQHHQLDYPSGRSERTCNHCGFEIEFTRVVHKQYSEAAHYQDELMHYAALANMGLDSWTRVYIQGRHNGNGSRD